MMLKHSSIPFIPKTSHSCKYCRFPQSLILFSPSKTPKIGGKEISKINQKRSRHQARICSLVEPVFAIREVEDVDSTNDSSNINPRTPPKMLIPYITGIVVQIMLKALACIYVVFTGLGKFFVVQSADGQSGSHQKSESTESTYQESLISQSIKERLQNLEAVVTDIGGKPTAIPAEKEVMLHQSLSRIKSIEHDLRKTKRALLATASKQVEVAESLESLKETRFNGTNSCWPKYCEPCSPAR